jgi:hypothetical protein
MKACGLAAKAKSNMKAAIVMAAEISSAIVKIWLMKVSSGVWRQWRENGQPGNTWRGVIRRYQWRHQSAKSNRKPASLLMKAANNENGRRRHQHLWQLMAINNGES